MFSCGTNIMPNYYLHEVIIEVLESQVMSFILHIFNYLQTDLTLTIL